MKSKLHKILNPKSIAIIGASNKVGSVGNELIKKLIDFGFVGDIYPVNIHDDMIEGLQAYRNVATIPVAVDMAVIAVPAQVVLSVIDECHSKRIDDVVVVSSGFKEEDAEGAKLQGQLVKRIEEYGMTLVGPNCLGVINADNSISMDASFAPVLPVRGNIGFATQSGALASGIINIMSDLGIGLAQMVSLGNQANITAIDVLEEWENDDRIKQILLYIESIENATKFREVATRVCKKKPVICIKSGRSDLGARATASHTGSLAGDDSLADGLLSSSGVLREIYLRDMFNTAKVIENCPLPRGKRLAILTNAGGPGIIATDTATDFGIELATLDSDVISQLNNILPPQASTLNPVDMIASATFEQYAQCADVLLRCDDVDMLLVIYLYITARNDIAVLQELNELREKYPTKPIVAVYMTTPAFMEEAKVKLPNSKVPVFSFVVDAVIGLRRLYDRQLFLSNCDEKSPNIKVNKKKARQIIDCAISEGITQLTTAQSMDIFDAYGLPMTKYGLAHSLEEAKVIANYCGYPVVIKISSKKISHKTDVGGVVTNIDSESALVREWNDLQSRLSSANLVQGLEGIVVMQQVKGTSRELVAGVVDKGSFGHQIMFGMGGVLVEILKEVSFRPSPLTWRDAEELIDSTKANKLLGEVRGSSAVDKRRVIECLMRLSKLVEDFPIIREIDANPLMIDNEGNLFAVDARVVL